MVKLVQICSHRFQFFIFDNNEEHLLRPAVLDGDVCCSYDGRESIHTDQCGILQWGNLHYYAHSTSEKTKMPLKLNAFLKIAYAQLLRQPTSISTRTLLKTSIGSTTNVRRLHALLQHLLCGRLQLGHRQVYWDSHRISSSHIRICDIEHRSHVGVGAYRRDFRSIQLLCVFVHVFCCQVNATCSVVSFKACESRVYCRGERGKEVGSTRATIFPQVWQLVLN